MWHYTMKRGWLKRVIKGLRMRMTKRKNVMIWVMKGIRRRGRMSKHNNLYLKWVAPARWLSSYLVVPSSNAF